MFSEIMAPSSSGPAPLWNEAVPELLLRLGATPAGLTAQAAAARLARDGPNRIAARESSSSLALLGRQFASPLVLLLLTAAALSLLLHDAIDAVVILVIVAASGGLGFWQERGATRAVAELLALVAPRATVLRDGVPVDVAVDDVVVGDVVAFAAGAGVPADCRLLEANSLFADEAALTGETFPVEKRLGTAPLDAAPAARTNMLFMGTHVVSGTGRALVVATAGRTEFGRISDRLRDRKPETEFERGVQRFGTFLLELTLVLVLIVFAINVYLAKPALDSLLFALALAVGMTPQLLPAIISVNLARGARAMASRKVVVRRLNAIENFGSMSVLCSDKTGTLTEGRVRLHSAIAVDGSASESVRRAATLNASLQTGFVNPIDEAVRREIPVAGPLPALLGEVPYDFVRKRLSVLAAEPGGARLLCKGAVSEMLAVCAWVELPAGERRPLDEMRDGVLARYAELSRAGLRTLAVAVRELSGATRIGVSDERELTLLGFLVFHDPLKADARQAIAALGDLGVGLKVITGDNALVAEQVGAAVAFAPPRIVTGAQLRATSDEALPALAERTDIFAEVEPNQKERIILALRRAGHVVGYMGDGINDAPALRAADAAISVQEAVDVAKSNADLVLLERDLGVLADGVREGRRTFANTLKYVFMATSANFGNMFSMAGASLLLPFLPLLPKQILLTNLLTDVPEMTIAGDSVDDEWIARPRRWDVAGIRRFMMVFGVLSSAFDYLTFGVLIWWLKAGPDEFRSGWFVESVVSATLIVLLVRTRRSVVRSRPARALTAATLAVAAVAVVLPYSPLAGVLGFVPLPPRFLAAMGAIVVAYLISAEMVKTRFYRAAAANL